MNTVPAVCAAAAVPFMATAGPDKTVRASEYYAWYHGHRVEHLAAVEAAARAQRKAVTWLVGDSTLDNKAWLCAPLGPSVPREMPVNGLGDVLDGPCVPDVAHHLNKLLERAGAGVVCINAAVEESTLGSRRDGRLLPQDVFVRDHLRPEDVVVSSLGGNDVALAPTLATVCSIVPLVWCSTKGAVERGTAVGFAHFESMFRELTAKYLEALTAKCKPRRVCVCMLYMLDERAGGSWADGTLRALGYNSSPYRVQRVIRALYERATKRVAVAGTEVVPVPLFEALDGSDTADYVQRVEPSVTGGEKLASLLIDPVTAPAAAPATQDATRA